MARKRMYSPEVVHQDDFLAMPQETQNLYFHLGLCADDEGFVSPKRVMDMIHTTEDNLKVLVAKKFVIPFESGVVVITHWQHNNFIRKDRFIPTRYQEELKELHLLGKIYQRLTSGQPVVNLVSKLVSKKEGEITSENGEEKGREAENLKNEEIKREEEEKIKKEKELINQMFGKVAAGMEQITAFLDNQKPQDKI